MKKLNLILFLFLVASSCGDVQTADFEDVGEAIIHPKDAPIVLNGIESQTPLAADQELSVTVIISNCISACAEIEDEKCSATIDGNKISITASATTSTDVEQICPASCGVLIATCELGVLSAADYNVTYGDSTVDFSIPNSKNVSVGSNAE